MHSVELSKRVNFPIYKISSGLLTNLPLLGEICKTQKPVLISTGMATEKEISEVEYCLFKKWDEYENVRQEDTKSVYPNIIKSIALLYDNLGMQDKAIQAVEEARIENPTDVDLILTEANINFRLGNNERYSELVSEALKQDPGNATLYYNLGVVSSELGEKKDAENYYNKAIELDPKMQNAYLNLVSLILEQENAIVEEMNSLGLSLIHISEPTRPY